MNDTDDQTPPAAGAAGRARAASLPIIIDVEASGFGPSSYPIEIGLVMETGDKYCTLVAPAPDWTHWDRSAEDVHRIPRDILETYGKPARTVAEDLNGLLDGRTVYTDGWVVDKPWITKLFHEGQVEPRFRTSALEMILSEDQMTRWHATKDRVLDELNLTRHRASYDALVIQQTWARTREKADAG